MSPKKGIGGRELLVLVLLAALPIAAHAPAWWNGRLLGPGDGTALHFPLRAAVWDAYSHRALPGWNSAEFCGTPLLAAYRPGALYPPMVLLALLPAFDAFQVLVLFSLAASAVLTFLYLRRLRAGVVGAYFAGLSFSLGPYLVGHLDDTTTIVAAPLLPLLLLSAESHMNRASAGRAVGLALAVALLLIVGSPEAARAGAILLFGRLLVGYAFPGGPTPPAMRWTLASVAAGFLLAAPQLLPTMFAALEAGRPITGLASAHDSLPGAMGLIMRYIAHTPAPALALGALPLITSHASVRVLALALSLSLGLQWGHPLNAHGMSPLVFDFTLAVLAGISLGAQWTLRGLRRGRRLRAYFLFFTLASSTALSVSAAALGPLPQALTGPVGVLALSLILYFSLAASPSPVRAKLWLLPLTVSFLLQPHGRDAWRGSATRRDVEEGRPIRAAAEGLMGRLGGERVMTLARRWPGDDALDMAYGGLSALSEGRSVNGYDPMVPLRTRHALGGMSVAGLLPEGFFRSDPTRLDVLGAHWIQAPTSDLVSAAQPAPAIHVTLAPGQMRLFPLPMLPATEVRLVSSLSAAIFAAQGQEIAVLSVRLASRRGEFTFPIRAGIETAEWAYDRPDVRAQVRHDRPPATDSWVPAGQPFEGHRYLAVLRLPGRYVVDAVRLVSRPGAPALDVSRIVVTDSGRYARSVSSTSAYVSDAGTFREVAGTPALRLFERPGGLGRAWVVEKLRVLPDGRAVLAALSSLTALGVDPYREALIERSAAPLSPIDGGRASRADIVRASAGRIDMRAEGPGWLVVAESWDRGWSAILDDAPVTTRRVNHYAMAVPLSEGRHRVSLRYTPPGLVAGLALSAATALAMGAALRLGRRAPRG